MCMNISKKHIVKINKMMGGSLRNDSSLDFALSMQENKKFSYYKKLSYLIRAILVDHPFSDGNKRTAAFIAILFAEDNRLTIDEELLTKNIIGIAKKNIINIRNIEWRLKKCNKPR